MSEVCESLFRDLPAHQAPHSQAPKKKKTGHAWAPGTGPSGETCASCKHYTIRRWAGIYRKCGLMREQWTQGPGTDIRARDAASKKWEPK